MPRSVRPLAALLALVLPGCLCFERQSVVIRTPAKGQKTAEILLVYEGLYETAVWDGHDATAQLKELAEGSRWYAGNPLAPGRLNPAAGPAVGLTVTSRHARLRPATFYTDPAGRLNLYQLVEVSDVPAFLDDLNTALSAALVDHPSDPFADRETAARNARLRQAAQKGHRWVEVEPGKVSFALPGTPEDLRHYRRRLFDPDAGLTGGHKPAELIGWLEGLARNPINIEQRRDRLILSVGLGDGLPIELAFSQGKTVDRETLRKLDPAGGPPDERLATFARRLGRPWARDVSAEILRKRFLAGELKE